MRRYPGARARAGGLPDDIDLWMDIAGEARRRAVAAAEDPSDLEAVCRICEHESIRVSLSNLESFPWIRSRLDAGDIQGRGVRLRCRKRGAEAGRDGRTARARRNRAGVT